MTYIWSVLLFDMEMLFCFIAISMGGIYLWLIHRSKVLRWPLSCLDVVFNCVCLPSIEYIMCWYIFFCSLTSVPINTCWSIALLIYHCKVSFPAVVSQTGCITIPHSKTMFAGYKTLPCQSVCLSVCLSYLSFLGCDLLSNQKII